MTATYSQTFEPGHHHNNGHFEHPRTQRFSSEELSWYFLGCTHALGSMKMCRYQSCLGCLPFAQDLAQLFNQSPNKSEDSVFEKLLSSGILLDLACVQNGAYYLQNVIEQSSIPVRTKLLEYFAPNFAQLSCDTFGNYVVQNFIQAGHAWEIQIIFNRLAPSMATLMRNPYGSRVVQRLVECSPQEFVKQVLTEVEGDLSQLCFDRYANYVIQMLLENLDAEHVYPVVNYFSGKSVWLAQHVHACRVLQTLISRFAIDSHVVDGLMKELCRSTCDLSSHEHGNYVIQCLLETLPEGSDLRRQIVGGLRYNLQVLSKNKFSSHVIEQVLTGGSDEDRELIVDSFRTLAPLAMHSIMTHHIGHYVANRIGAVSSRECVDEIIERVKSEGIPCKWVEAKAEFATRKLSRARRNNAAALAAAAAATAAAASTAATNAPAVAAC